MRSKLAVWSFVLSLLPIVTYLLLLWIGYSGFNLLWFISFLAISLISLIFEIISLSIIKKHRLEGKNFAVVGLIFSLLTLAYFLLGAWIFSLLGFKL